MHGVAMSPKAGAHGELCGLLCIRAALEARGDAREVVLVPESAHGTNPATAAFCGYRVENIPATKAGPRRSRSAEGAARPGRRRGDDHQPQHLRPVRAGHEGDQRRGPCRGRLRLLRRRQFQRHRRQGPPRRPRHRRDAHQPAQDLLDPARRRRAGLGSGGAVGGAGAVRPAAVRRANIPTAATSWSRRKMPARSIRDTLRPDGRLPRPDGHVHPRADLHPQPRRRRPAPGRRGQRAQRQLHPAQPGGRARRAVRAFAGRACMRRSSAIKASPRASRRIDVAKALIDEGFHPMTMYFPLVVHGAMLVEPTETESKASLDQFIAALRSIAERARAGDEALKAAPVFAPRRRLDETLAARKPVLAYKTPAPDGADAWSGEATLVGGKMFPAACFTFSVNQHRTFHIKKTKQRNFCKTVFGNRFIWSGNIRAGKRHIH